MKFFTLPLLESRYEVHYCRIFAPISRTKMIFASQLIQAGNDARCESEANFFWCKLLTGTNPVYIDKVVRDNKDKYCTISIYKVDGKKENGKFVPVCYNTVRRCHIPFEVIKQYLKARGNIL